MPKTKIARLNIDNTYLFGGMLTVALAGLLFFANMTTAADEYTFLVRGDVMKINTSENTIDVYSRWTNSAAENDLGGHIKEIKVDSAKYWKYDSKQNKVRTTLGSLNLGDEVVVAGAKKTAGHFNASAITRNDNLVDIKGTVDSHVTGGHRDSSDYGILKVDLANTGIVFNSTGKAYKSALYPQSTIISIYYDKDSIKFKSRDGNDMNADEMKNNGEKVTVEGVKVKYGSRFVGDGALPVTVVTDDKHKF